MSERRLEEIRRRLDQPFYPATPFYDKDPARASSVEDDVRFLLSVVERQAESVREYINALDRYREDCEGHGIPMAEYDHEAFAELAKPLEAAEERLRLAHPTDSP